MVMSNIQRAKPAVRCAFPLAYLRQENAQLDAHDRHNKLFALPTRHD